MFRGCGATRIFLPSRRTRAARAAAAAGGWAPLCRRRPAALVSRGTSGALASAVCAFSAHRRRPGARGPTGGLHFEKRVPGGEVFVAGQARLRREVVALGEEESERVGGEDVPGVLGEEPRVEVALIELAVEEPRPAQPIAEWFSEESVAAHAAERRADTGLEQWPGRDGGTALGIVESVNGRRTWPALGLDVTLAGPSDDR